MGIVPQDPFLFDASIMENVRYSRHGASDEDVVEACKAAAIHEKILTYADGYQTRVIEHGIKLSKGEIQQIAIARVLLQNPKIVLLEEPTSCMESQTESLVQLALQQLGNGRTTFTVAHKYVSFLHHFQCSHLHLLTRFIDGLPSSIRMSSSS